jgi:ATP-binding cassette subfamily C (CFTR/MRP) protein 4
VVNAYQKSAEVEIMFVSVERMLEYAQLEVEAPRHTSLVPAKDWPQAGQIELKDMSLTYPNTDRPVLKHINITIKVGKETGFKLF